MNGRMFAALGMTAGALLISASALAHHGRGLIYDTSKPLTVKGTVTEFVWSNPHVQIGIEAVDARGTRRQWLLETSSTPIMATRGWTRKSLKVGESVTATFHPGFRGAAIGDLLKLVFADGKELAAR